MRIVHTIPSLDINSAGPSYSVPALCSHLIDLGLNVNLVTLRASKQIDNLPYIRSFSQDKFIKRLGFSFEMSHWLDDEAKNRKIDVIHTHSLWMMPNIYPGWVSAKYNIPFVVSPRGTLSEWAFKSGSIAKNLVWPLLQKPALKSVACFHATAYSEYEDIRRMGFKQPVVIIPNGIDFPIRKNVKKNKKKLLFLSRIHPKKGLDILLEAWSLLHKKHSDWTLDIAGPDGGSYEAKLKDFVFEKKIDRVNFIGPLYGDDKWNAYANSSLFVLPSFSENFGMVIAEALASSLPVIVSKGTPWQDVAFYNAGWWVDISLDTLTKTLDDAMSSQPDDLILKGENGKKMIHEKCSWPKISKQMLETYAWLNKTSDEPEFLIKE
jgi:glycosyltransferase involved in cell wall biosynthesis